MKEQIEILRELQERILIREGGLAGLADAEGVGRNMAEIAHLAKMLEPKVAATYEWLLKKNRIVIAAMSDGACTGCGIRVPTALQQTVKLGKVMCVCPNCGRILYDEPEDAVRGLVPKMTKKPVSNATLARFSAESLVIPELKGITPEIALGDLSLAMEAAGYVTSGYGLAVEAWRRETLLNTTLGDGLAFPHVRIEGGKLTFAIGHSTQGIDWGGKTVHYVFLATIPLVSSAYYAKLVAGIVKAFADPKKRGWVEAAEGREGLWKAILKATRVDTK